MIFMNAKGGLGNQLFQAAMALVLNKATGVDYKFLIDSYNNYSYGHIYLLEKYFQCCSDRSMHFSEVPANTVLLREPATGNHLQDFKNSTIQLIGTHENILLDGYFGSEVYFQEYEDLIKEKLTPISSNLLDYQTSMNIPHIGVHVRRFEYGHHGLAKFDYYRNSVKLIRKKHGNLPVLVFSDEYNVCSFEFNSIENCTIVKGDNLNPINDFITLLKCKHYVLSNSTFSFWAAFLGEEIDSEVFIPFPFCIFNEFNPLNNRLQTWNIIEGAVCKS